MCDQERNTHWQKFKRSNRKVLNGCFNSVVGESSVRARKTPVTNAESWMVTSFPYETISFLLPHVEIRDNIMIYRQTKDNERVYFNQNEYFLQLNHDLEPSIGQNEFDLNKIRYSYFAIDRRVI